MCGLPARDPAIADLQQGVGVVRRLMSPMVLQKSMFVAAYPNGRPSDYVDYFFSDMAAAESPPSESETRDDPMYSEQRGMMKQPVWPDGVLYFANAPNPEKTCEDARPRDMMTGKLSKETPPCCGCQIILSADDAKGVVVLRGYMDPGKERLVADPVAKMSYDSYREEKDYEERGFGGSMAP